MSDVVIFLTLFCNSQERVGVLYIRRFGGGVEGILTSKSWLRPLRRDVMALSDRLALQEGDRYNLLTGEVRLLWLAGGWLVDYLKGDLYCKLRFSQVTGEEFVIGHSEIKDWHVVSPTGSVRRCSIVNGVLCKQVIVSVVKQSQHISTTCQLLTAPPVEGEVRFTYKLDGIEVMLRTEGEDRWRRFIPLPVLTDLAALKIAEEIRKRKALARK